MKGNWRGDLLFELRSSLSLYDTYCKKIEECDIELERGIKSIVEERKDELQDRENQTPLKGSNKGINILQNSMLRCCQYSIMV